MSVIAVTIRPNGKRTEILNLPYEGKGRGYAILGDMIGASRQGQVQYAGGVWAVSRPHTNKVILGLAARYGKVKVMSLVLTVGRTGLEPVTDGLSRGYSPGLRVSVTTRPIST
ncbi:MAG TPA: hypothetical protein VEX88_04565 [Glaciibacter sp.]|nr:hypothetical protein [Glaciibacter sp.]